MFTIIYLLYFNEDLQCAWKTGLIKEGPVFHAHVYNALLFSCFMEKFVYKTDFPIRLTKESINAYHYYVSAFDFLIKIYNVHGRPGS